MDIAERLVGAVMAGTLDEETGLQLVELHTRVCRDIFCPECKKVMDTQKSAIATITIGNSVQGPLVLCGTCWDGLVPVLKKEFENLTAKVVDFRDYNLNGTKRKAPRGGKKPRAPKTANMRIHEGALESVVYSKRFEGSGFTWFIHGEKKAWKVSSWDCGYALGTFDTQKQGMARARMLTDEQISIVKGSISLHGGANEPVKGGKVS